MAVVGNVGRAFWDHEARDIVFGFRVEFGGWFRGSTGALGGSGSVEGRVAHVFSLADNEENTDPRLLM